MTERHNDTYPAIDPLTKSNLDGKTVLVTGASKGIGSVIAIAYAKAGAANIALAARSSVDPTESEIFAAARSAGKAVPRVLKLQVDITNLKSVEAAARQTEEAFGKLDILVNNAGFLEKLGSIVDKDAEEWWTTWDINIRGTFHMARAFIPLLLAGRDKTMLNMNSIAAISYQPGASAYQASKLALLRLTELMVTEYGPQGLLAYSLHPGGVATDMSHKLPQAAHSRAYFSTDRSSDSPSKQLLIPSPSARGHARIGGRHDCLSHSGEERVAGGQVHRCPLGCASILGDARRDCQ